MGVDCIVNRTKKYSGIVIKIVNNPLTDNRGKSFSLSRLKRSFVFTSEKLARIPESILPPTEYLWISLSTRLQSGKCLLMSSKNFWVISNSFLDPGSVGVF